jgi:hypothetical protein
MTHGTPLAKQLLCCLAIALFGLLSACGLGHHHHGEGENHSNSGRLTLRVISEFKTTRHLFIDDAYKGLIEPGAVRDFSLGVGHHHVASSEKPDRFEVEDEEEIHIDVGEFARVRLKPR